MFRHLRIESTSLDSMDKGTNKGIVKKKWGHGGGHVCVPLTHTYLYTGTVPLTQLLTH